MIRTTTGWTYADKHGIPVGVNPYVRHHLWKPQEWFWYATDCTWGEPEGLYGQFRRFWLRMEGDSYMAPEFALGAELNAVGLGRFVVTEVIKKENNVNGASEFTVKARAM